MCQAFQVVTRKVRLQIVLVEHLKRVPWGLQFGMWGMEFRSWAQAWELGV